MRCALLAPTTHWAGGRGIADALLDKNHDRRSWVKGPMPALLGAAWVLVEARILRLTFENSAQMAARGWCRDATTVWPACAMAAKCCTTLSAAKLSRPAGGVHCVGVCVGWERCACE